jgi:GT2 family glycosyltransferase
MIDGYIDYYGYSPTLEGWLFAGWVQRSSLPSGGLAGTSPIAVDDDKLAGEALTLLYDRPDIVKFGMGLLGFVAAPESAEPQFLRVRLGTLAIAGSDATGRRHEPELLGDAQHEVAKVTPARSGAFGKLFGRAIDTGQNTLAALGKPVWVGFDEVLVAPGIGVALIGWLFDPTGCVGAVRVRSGKHVSNDLAERWVRVERFDIKDSFAADFAIERADWGFHALAALDDFDPAAACLEVETVDGRIGYESLPAPTRVGRAAIVRWLAGVRLAREQILDVCGKVLAPAVSAINRDHLNHAGMPQILTEGVLPEHPRCSLIVPLYGRLDLMMYQMALASETDTRIDEYIYVLDEPHRYDEFLTLSHSVHARFGIPLRLVVPGSSLGFAGASNIGLAAARGRFVCFLNSDVMPQPGDWVGKLIAGLEADPGIGLIAPRLLFEDNTLQHGGMILQRHPEYGGLGFPAHPGKGRVLKPSQGVRRVDLLTGACLMLRCKLAERLGGFSIDYAVGDFEDADLCMRVQAEGLDCAVDEDVALYHLERQSQSRGDQGWRQNLTLVNAWTFYDRWGEAVDASRWRPGATG